MIFVFYLHPTAIPKADDTAERGAIVIVICHEKGKVLNFPLNSLIF